MQIDSFHKRQTHRLYGAMCGSSNLLLVAKGTISHDPMIQTGAWISIAAQAGNTTFGDAARPATTPALILSGATFAASAIHPGVISLADVGHIGFGVCKMAGITALFYGQQLGQYLKKAPLMRFLSKFRSENVGEILLGIGASSMATDGARLVIEGVGEHNPTKLSNGACTLLAMALFISGNRVRAMASVSPE